MDEYITRAEFEQFKKQMEQKTEEMKAIRVDVHNVDVEAFRQELHTVSNTWLDTLQSHYTEHKQDISKVQTVQSGHSKFFEEHGKRLSQIETTMATKESISQLRDEMKADMIAMETRIIDTMTRLIQQKPNE
jgi:cytochrome c556